jgi:uncharacterized membrane protein
MSKGGSQTSSTSIDPQIKAKYLQQVGQAEKVAGGLGVQEFAGFDPMYQAAEKASYEASMKPFGAEDIMAFKNPYEQDVVNTSLKDIEEARQMQALSDAQQATGAKAFGGSRQAVQSALSNEAALKTAARTSAQLRSAGYGQSAALAQAARGMNQQGYQTAMNLGLGRQSLAQQQLDAQRNLALQRLGITQLAISGQPANIGQVSTQPTYRNAGAGALGGVLAGAQIGSAIPGIGTGIGAGVGGLLGLFG